MLETQERGLLVLPREIERETLTKEPLPIPVVPDWDEQARESTAMVKLIDRHLDYEERGRRLLPNERLTQSSSARNSAETWLPTFWRLPDNRQPASGVPQLIAAPFFCYESYQNKVYITKTGTTFLILA